MNNILVVLSVNDEHKKLLESSAPSADFTYSDQESVSEEQVRNAEIIIGNPPAHLLKASKKLRWLQLQSAGAGEYTSENVLPKGAILTNASGAYGLAISEYMLGVTLELFKKLHLYRDLQLKSDWSYVGKVRSIYKSTALIVGLGDIGGEFASRLKALGAYTIGIKRRIAGKPEYIDELYTMDELGTVLPRADIVALSLPATKHTARIINEKTIGLMKRDAVIINVGRGNAIDTEALCDALESGRIAGAALDVTDPEPLPEDHRLWKIKNAVITPHVSGGFSLQETHDRIVAICADNLKAWFSGKSLKNVVDLTEGY
ncbi:MAG TPA: D-2-hydroxyacid dehydrogenase [Clostridia bacterium]|nr:D-2-hydroxyacid dehydrogenase [Clostridia bacterium]